MKYFVPRKNLLGRPENNSPSPRTNVPRLTILVFTNNGLMYLSNNFVGIMYSLPYKTLWLMRTIVLGLGTEQWFN